MDEIAGELKRGGIPATVANHVAAPELAGRAAAY
jgi:hypothetical protein